MRTLCISLLLTSCGGDDAVLPNDEAGPDEVPTLDAPADGEGFQISMTTVAPTCPEVWADSLHGGARS